MPSTLIPPEIASACFSPELMRIWLSGSEPTSEELSANEKVVAARRKAIGVLRRIMMETEKMRARLLGGGLKAGRVGGVQAIWEQWTRDKVEDERGTITAAEAAEWLLNAESTAKPVRVRPNTLPAFAAHDIMMHRPDLFLADSVEMWKTGRMMVRSKAEKRRFDNVSRWFEGDPNGKEVSGFREKVKIVMEFSRSLQPSESVDINAISHQLPQWSATDLDIISVLTTRLFETRSTQISPTIGLSMTILKGLNIYPGETVDQILVTRFLEDIGVLLPWDSQESSKAKETELRNTALAGTQITGSNDLLHGTELDSLREDFTDQTVYIIDDPTASELDDGISLERIDGSTDHWLHIHVADPTRYLNVNHPMAIQASFRGSSLYLVEGGRPLLPLEITMKELSLGADVDKHEGRQGVMTFSARIGSDGQVKDEKVRMGWIKKSKVVTYEAVNELLGVNTPEAGRPFGIPAIDRPAKPNTPVSPEEAKDLQTLRDLAVMHRKHRLRSTGWDWFLPSSSLKLAKPVPTLPDNIYDRNHLASTPTPRFFSGTPVIDYSVPTDPPTPVFTSNQLVAEFMILAGRIAASFCHSRSIPIPFRWAATPISISTPSGAITPVEEVLSQRDEFGAVDPYLMTRANIYHPPSGISTKLTPHWIMGFDESSGYGYCRATSPLRRYDDLLVHWQIKSALAKERGITSPYPDLSEEEVITLAKRSEVSQKRNKRAGANSSKWWQAGLIRSRMTGTGPLASTSMYQGQEGMVDLYQPMEARVMGVTELLTGTQEYTAQVYLPGLGAVARLLSRTDEKWEIGSGLKVRLKEVLVLPAPLLLVTPA